MRLRNQVSFNISESDLAEIEALIHQIEVKLKPYLITLSPEERIELPRMGDKTFGFVQKTLEYCHQNPDLVPRFLNVEQFEIDFRGFRKAYSLHQQLLQITRPLADTTALSGSEAYKAALIFYQSVKNAMKLMHQTTGTIFNDLFASFPRGKRKP